MNEAQELLQESAARDRSYARLQATAAANVMSLDDQRFIVAWSSMTPEQCAAVEGGHRRYDRLMSGGSAGTAQTYRTPAPEANVYTRVAATTKTARDLYAANLRPLEQVIEGLVPEGAHILAGRPKVGKSWFALHAALAVAHGKPFLGFKTLQGDVLYLALEDSDRRMKSRLAKLLPDTAGAWPETFEYATEWPTLDAKGDQRIVEWLDEHPAARLVVIDVLAKVKPLRLREEGVYDADYRVTNAIKAILAHKPGIALVVVTHLRKQAADDPLDLVTGSAGLTGGVDGALVLERARGEGEAVLHRISRDLEDTEPLGLLWDRELAVWRRAGSAEELRASGEQRAVLAALREAGEPLLPREIADAAKLSQGSVRHLVRKMERAGMLRRIEGASNRHRYEVCR